MIEVDKITGLIFDLDGTLYPLPHGSGIKFTQTPMYAEIRKNIARFLSACLGISEAAALDEYGRLKQLYPGDIQRALEAEHHIDRMEFYRATWRVSPAKYVKRFDGLPIALGPFEGRIAVLTASPAVWALPVLDFLGVHQLFGEQIFTGEPDLRKPDPLIFAEVARSLGSEPKNTVAIGDQANDIVPAKALGMHTIKIGGDPLIDADYQVANIFEALSLLSKRE